MNDFAAKFIKIDLFFEIGTHKFLMNNDFCLNEK